MNLVVTNWFSNYSRKAARFITKNMVKYWEVPPKNCKSLKIVILGAVLIELFKILDDVVLFHETPPVTAKLNKYMLIGAY